MPRKPVELRLKVPWGHVAALAWGNPWDQPVLVAHGTLDNAGSFTRLIQLLPEHHYYYVAIDQPSHGLSSHYPNGVPLDIGMGVVALKYVLDELKWKKCYYIGHSSGGAAAIFFQAIFPGTLEKIVTIDIVSGYNFDPDQVVERLKAIFTMTVRLAEKREPRLYTREEILDAFQNDRIFKLTREAAEALFERGTTKVGDKYVYNKDERLNLYMIPTFSLDQYVAFFKRQPVPILVISPKESLYKLAQQPETLDLIREKFSDKFMVVEVDGNHDVHNNNPEIVAPHIIKFFADRQSKL